MGARVFSEKRAKAGNRLRQTKRGDEVAAVTAARASFLHEKQRELQPFLRMAAHGEIDVRLIEVKDRFPRFGFGYPVQAFGAHGVRVGIQEEGPVACGHRPGVRSQRADDRNLRYVPSVWEPLSAVRTEGTCDDPGCGGECRLRIASIARIHKTRGSTCHGRGTGPGRRL